MEVGRHVLRGQEQLPHPMLPSKKELLSRFIEEHAQTLLQGLRLYVLRGHICRANEVEDTTWEVLDEAVREALTHADRFDPSRPAMAWLLRIGANVVLRRRVANARRFKHESLESELLARGSETDADGSFFDDVTDSLEPGPGEELEAKALAQANRERAQAILAQLSPEDQEILRLAVMRGLKSPEVARRLGITSSNARVRLHRALMRARQSLERSTKEEAGNG